MSNASLVERTPVKRKWISVFLVFHLFVIILWSIPVKSRPVTRIRRIMAPYMEWSGLSQGWYYFAPEPMTINARVVAQITYRDGQTKIWKFPLPQDYGYYQRYFLTRDLTWGANVIRIDDFAMLWPDAARYAARVNNIPDNPPVSVTFIRYWSFVPPPTSGQSPTWDHYAYFTYTVSPRDLM